MSPQVEAAIIAARVGVLTLIGTVAAQFLGRRATSRDTEKVGGSSSYHPRGRLRTPAGAYCGGVGGTVRRGSGDGNGR